MPNTPIKLIVGLGNPGPEYDSTRHNAGYWFVDQLAEQHHALFRPDPRFYGLTCQIRLKQHEVRLLKPTTYMNRSGQSVSSLAGYFKISPDEILVAHDELDLPAGSIRLKSGGGHAGHNGLRDIVKALGGNGFHRLRIGIDRPMQGSKTVDYVLGRPSKADLALIDEAISNATAEIENISAGMIQKVMNHLHTENAPKQTKSRTPSQNT